MNRWLPKSGTDFDRWAEILLLLALLGVVAAFLVAWVSLVTSHWSPPAHDTVPPATVVAGRTWAI